MNAFKFALAASVAGVTIAAMWVFFSAVAFVAGRWCAQLLGWL